MSKFKVGTLVMAINMPAVAPVPSGSVGEVQSCPPNRSVEVTNEVVLFPRCRAENGEYVWQISSRHLLPINDPDAELGSEDETKLTDKKPNYTEDLV